MAIKRQVANLSESQVKITANKIIEECNLSHVTTRTVRRALRRVDFNYIEAEKRIQLTSDQKRKRVEMATMWLDAMWPWDKVVWSDEKRFNLDGPDSWSTWVRKGQIVERNRRQQGGASLQIWGMLMPDGTLVYRELHQRSKSEDYIELLREFVKPYLDCELDENYIFQQDNASIHVSRQTSEWMRGENLSFMEWPSKSPDLSPIENVWSLLSSIVYDGKQFNNVKDLREAIERAVNHINNRDRHKVMNIRDSIQRRLRLCIGAKGGRIKY